MARCTSYKFDKIKQTTSISLNVALENEEEEAIGSGVNINISNLDSVREAGLLRILGVEKITEMTPFSFGLTVLKNDEDKRFWTEHMATEEKELPPEQSKLPGAATPPEKNITKPPKEPKLAPLDKTVAAILDDPEAMEDLAEKSEAAVAGAKTDKEAIAAVAKVAERAMKKKGAEIERENDLERRDLLDPTKEGTQPRGSKAIIELAQQARNAKSQAGKDLKHEIDDLIAEADKLGIDRGGMSEKELRKAIAKKKGK